MKVEIKETSEKPEGWPKNRREWKLDVLCERMEEFKNNPTYKNREILIALASEHDMNETSGYGLVRITEYEVGLINYLYLVSQAYQINSVKVYLYDLISEATYIHKWMVNMNPVLGKDGNEDQFVEVYSGLDLPLKLYYLAYQKFIIENDDDFATQLISVIHEVMIVDQEDKYIDSITHAFVSMMNDLSYMRGSKKQSIWKFSREELSLLFELEAELLKRNNESPIEHPTKGVLMTQISNFILKSRNGYNEDYICKYLPIEVARESVKNHQIWMKKTTLLNDEREQRVVPELFEDKSWITYKWVSDINFTATRIYYVSSFSKSVNNSDMQDGYGQCLYGYKNDRISELIAPIGIWHLKKKAGVENDMPNEIERPYIAQTLAFDVIYDVEEARRELTYLFGVIDMFNMSDAKKKKFLEEIMQYWILSVKDAKWSGERERRYVIFMYDDYDYRETEIDDTFLKVKTSIFLTPDFIIGKNPSRYEILYQLNAKRHALYSREYMLCKNCFLQDYDQARKMPEKCPICGSDNVELIIEEE